MLSFLQDLKRSLKNCSKKACFPREKNGFGLHFLLLQSKADLKEKSLTVCNEVQHFFCASYKVTSIEPKRSLETNFSKKSLSSR